MFEQLYDNSGAAHRVLVVKFEGDGFPAIRCTAAALTSVAELVLRGYRRSPWGGVETGGVLFGTRAENGITVRGYRELECEHAHGPAFELSDKDFARLERLITDAAADESLKGLSVVGWFHSVSSRELAVTQIDRKLHDRCFAGPLQIAMVLRRSRKNPLAIGFFHRDATGSLQAHSTQREFPVEDFQLREASLPADPPAEPEQPQPDPPAAAVESSAAPMSLAALVETLAESKAAGPALSPAALGNPFEFFGLKQDPFAQNPDPRFYYPAPSTREALAILQHGVQLRTGFLALIGEAGVGKSLVIECLIEHLEEQEIPFAYLFNSKVSVEQFFELLADDFGLKCPSPSKAAVLIALNERLVERSREGQTTVLIIDNAQKLNMEVLEEVELLGNLETRRGKLLQVIFAGQPSFERLLDRAELRGLRQRMFHHAQVAPLDEKQIGLYVQSRLATAGLPAQSIFGSAVLSLLHRRTRGVPRLINAVCGEVMQRLTISQRKAADESIVEEVCRAMDLERVLAGQEAEAEAMSA